MGMSAALTIYQKEPNMMRMDIDVMGMLITQAFDGEKGWFINPQTGVAEEMNEKQSQAQRLQAMGYDAALNPEKYGITFVLKGKEKVGDKDYYLVEQTFKDGFQATLYINTATFLTEQIRSKTDAMGTEIDVETLMDGLQERRGLDGSPFPDDSPGRRGVRQGHGRQGGFQHRAGGFVLQDAVRRPPPGGDGRDGFRSSPFP